MTYGVSPIAGAPLAGRRITSATGTALSGTSDTLVDGSGDLTAATLLAGTSDSVVDGSGALTVGTPLSGTSDTLVDGSGNLSTAAGTALSGTSDTVTDGSGVVSATTTLAGTSDTVVDGSGDLTALASGTHLSGTSDTLVDGSGILFTSEVAGLELAVYDITGGFLAANLIATDALVKGIEWMEVLNQPGSGRFQLHADSTSAWSLTSPDNVIVALVDGIPVFSWRTDTRSITLASSGEDADRWITAQGPGRLADLGWAVQYPTPPTTRTPGAVPDRGALDWEPASDDRAWTWANWNYDISAAEAGEPWVDCTGLYAVGDTASPWKGHPTSFPDAGAWWIYPGAGASPQPSGISYYRERFTPPSAMRCKLFAAADDSAEIWLDEALVLQVEGWHEIAETIVVLDANEHLIAPRVFNHLSPDGDTPSGIVWSLIELTIDPTSGDEVLGAVICRSHGTGGGTPSTHQRVDPVRGLANPTITPGFWPGQMLGILIEEAKERVVESFTWLDYNFAGTLDSDGNAYPERLDVLLRLGMNYQHIINVIVQTSCDVSITPDGGTVRLHATRGVDRATGGANDVELLIGQDFTSLTDSTSETRAVRATSLLCRDDAGWREHRRTTAIAEHGRREDFLADGDASSPVQSARTAKTALDLHSVPDEQLTLGQADTGGPMLWRDFFVGDVIWAPSGAGGRQRVRVVTGNGKIDDQGNLTVVPGVAIV